MPEVKDWINKANTDLKSAKKLIKEDDDTLDSAAYFTQQAAEKALKTYLVFKQKPILKTHDLEKLLIICMADDPSFNQLRKEAELLSPYATYTRYPDDRFNIDREEVVEAIKCAEKIIKFVKTKIELPKNSPQLNLFNN